MAALLKFPSKVPPYKIDIPIPKVEGLGNEYKAASVMLPHQVFSTLYEEWPSQFDQIFCTDKVSEFWERESQHRAPPPHAARTIPLRAWGDDSSRCKTSGFLAMNWCSCLAWNLSANFSLLIFGCLDLKQCDLPSFEKCYTVFVWSMQQLFRGTHPSHYHEGKSWSDLGDAARQKRAGTPLAGTWRAVLCEYTGDWKWLHESLQITWFYIVMEVCWNCLAQNNSGNVCMTNVSHPGPCRNPAAQQHFNDYVAFHHGRLPALARIWQFTLRLCLRIDWMHVGPLGRFSRVAGSCLFSLCGEGRFGVFTGPWAIRVNNALRSAYRKFTKWSNNMKLTHSQGCFTAAQMNCPEYCHQYPDLKAKAHNTVILLRWIAHVCETDTYSEEAKLRSALAWALSSLHLTFSEGPEILSEQQLVISISRFRRDLRPGSRLSTPEFGPRSKRRVAYFFLEIINALCW